MCRSREPAIAAVTEHASSGERSNHAGWIDPSDPMVLAISHIDGSGAVDGDRRWRLEPSRRSWAAIATETEDTRPGDRFNAAIGPYATDPIISAVGDDQFASPGEGDSGRAP